MGKLNFIVAFDQLTQQISFVLYVMDAMLDEGFMSYSFFKVIFKTCKWILGGTQFFSGVDN